MNKEALEFISKNKYFYLEWLSKREGFPHICTIASDVLGSYINEKFGENTAILHFGWFETFNEDLLSWDNKHDIWINPFHAFLTIDDRIIDFTTMQFTTDIPEELMRYPGEYIMNMYPPNVQDYKKDDIRYKANIFFKHVFGHDEVRDVIFSKSSDIYWRFNTSKKYKAYKFRKLVKESENFIDYLNKVEESFLYTNYKYKEKLLLTK